MGFWAILLIAFALAFDAFAVALAAGFNLRKVTWRQTIRLAFHFGFFQAMMNVCGWAGGLTFRTLIEHVDHWVAFGLLGVVGLHMIVGALKEKDEEAKAVDPTKGKSLVVLSIATSIDALAVGLSFSMLKIAIVFPAIVIGLVAFAMTAIGMHLGRVVSSFTKLGAEAEIVGGIVLIGLGINILWSHGVF
jgi:putative Mn2+ efflux pump MntP